MSDQSACGRHRIWLANFIVMATTLIDAKHTRFTHRLRRPEWDLEGSGSAVPTEGATTKVHRRTRGRNRRMRGATRFAERRTPPDRGRSDRTVAPASCSGETNQSLTVSINRSGNGYAPGERSGGHDQAVNAGVSGFGIEDGSGNAPRVPKRRKAAAEDIATHTGSCAHGACRARPAAQPVQALRQLLDGEAVGHQAARSISLSTSSVRSGKALFISGHAVRGKRFLDFQTRTAPGVWPTRSAKIAEPPFSSIMSDADLRMRQTLH